MPLTKKTITFAAISLVILPLLASGFLNTRQEDGGGLNVVYERFHIDSVIVARYATTSITSAILNNADKSKELSFQVQLPDTAFISSFSMMVNGTTFVGVAQEKGKAEEEFEQRQNAGENVGLVESRGTNIFRIRINTAANSRSTFVLEYEELLLRQLSKYRQILNLNPGTIVEDFRVTIRVSDEQGIAVFTASDYVTKERVSSDEITYTYAPSVADQSDESFGLARDMMIEYDVNHPQEGAGLIIVNDCFFAQFFSPSGISPIPVDIVFVIDVSGSMAGDKIFQARESLAAVISQLRNNDRFNIVTFESVTSTWMNALVLVSEYRNQGMDYARSLTAGGGTNFAEGMQDGIDMLKLHGNEEYIQLLVILTDGEPTVGITGEDEIINLAKRSLVGTRISINTLGFGIYLNFQLLLRLSLSNRGISMRIYEGSDAADQLKGFYEEISSPILYSINVTYPPNSLETVSNLNFPLLFNGSEIVVAGKFSDELCLTSTGTIPVTVRGMGTSNEVTFQSEVSPKGNTVIAGVQPSTERLVAYFTIRQLLDEVKITDDETTMSMLKERSLSMALQYNFVTELTSLLVVESSNDTSSSVNFTTTGSNLVDTEDEVKRFSNGGASGLSSIARGSPSVVTVVVVVVVVPVVVMASVISTIVIVTIVVVRLQRARSNRSGLQLVSDGNDEVDEGHAVDKENSPNDITKTDHVTVM